MDGKTLARVGAVAFVAVAITVTVIEARQPPVASPAAAAVIAVPKPDELGAELSRCQAIGAAGASDPACLRTWAETRRRFLGSPRRLPVEPVPDLMPPADAPVSPTPVAGAAPVNMLSQGR